jgi:hypothetical protein
MRREQNRIPHLPRSRIVAHEAAISPASNSRSGSPHRLPSLRRRHPLDYPTRFARAILAGKKF